MSSTLNASKAPRALTVVEAMRELQEVRAIPVCVGPKIIWVRTDITGNANKLFSATCLPARQVGFKPPPKVLHLAEKPENVVAQNPKLDATT